MDDSIWNQSIRKAMIAQGSTWILMVLGWLSALATTVIDSTHTSQLCIHASDLDQEVEACCRALWIVLCERISNAISSREISLWKAFDRHFTALSADFKHDTATRLSNSVSTVIYQVDACQVMVRGCSLYNDPKLCGHWKGLKTVVISLYWFFKMSVTYFTNVLRHASQNLDNYSST